MPALLHRQIAIFRGSAEMKMKARNWCASAYLPCVPLRPRRRFVGVFHLGNVYLSVSTIPASHYDIRIKPASPSWLSELGFPAFINNKPPHPRIRICRGHLIRVCVGTPCSSRAHHLLARVRVCICARVCIIYRVGRFNIPLITFFSYVFYGGCQVRRFCSFEDVRWYHWLDS